jgi:hypothetical protein
MLTDDAFAFRRVRLVLATRVLGGSSANRTLLASDLTPSTFLSSFLDGSRKTGFSATSSVLRFKLTHYRIRAYLTVTDLPAKKAPGVRWSLRFMCSPSFRFAMGKPTAIAKSR